MLELHPEPTDLAPVHYPLGLLVFPYFYHPRVSERVAFGQAGGHILFPCPVNLRPPLQ